MTTEDGRTLHYGEFYGVADTKARDDRRTLVVWGNCQAEALRILLASSADLRYRTVRVPPVHELTEADIPHVERLMAGADVIASQPVRAGYRGLPTGTPDIVSMARPGTTRIVWPVVRYGGLFPFQVIVRHPADPSAVPAGVPYHDLRTVLAVRNGRVDGEDWDLDVTADRIRDAARWSVEVLAGREARDCDIGVSDVLLGLGDEAAHTINHPGNAVLLTLARRVLDSIGAGAPHPPERELLGMLRAPLERRVVDALGLDVEERPDWMLDGVTTTPGDVHRAQMAWYAEHPEFIDAALRRYRELLDILGLRS